MVTVRFYGSLKQFGVKFELECHTVAEIFQALISQIQGLKKHIHQGFFKIRIGKEYLDNRYLEKGLFYQLKSGMTVHITPVLKGAKRGGIFQTLIGAAVIGLMFWNPIGWSAAVVKAGIGFGAALALGGVAQMLTPMPKSGNTSSEQEKKTSTSFSNLANMTAQGKMLPLAYGKIRTGSLIISQGVETYDVETYQAKTTKAGFGKGRLV